MRFTKETLGATPSASTSIFTKAPSSCSTDGLPQQSMVAQVLVSSSPSTPTEYTLDTNNILVAAASLAVTGRLLSVAAGCFGTYGSAAALQ
jgi:hypothetical protein